MLTSDVLVPLLIAGLLLYCGLLLFRIADGPTAADRMVAIDILGTVVVVFLHTSHGVQSLFQTLGLTQPPCALSTFQGVGRFLSTVFLVGYGLIPIAILADFLTLTK